MSEFEFGPYRLDVRRQVVTQHGAPLPLGPKVVMTLAALVERAGEVVSKEELLERVWPGDFVEESNLTQNVYVLRKVLSRGWNVRPIVTVPRRGYRFVAPVWVAPERVAPMPAAGVREPANGAVRTSATASLRSAVQRPAVLAFVACLIALSVVGATGSSRVAPLSPAGAQRYALGRYYWNQRTPSALRRSLRYFESVVHSDPRNPLGYDGAADAYMLLPQYDVRSLPSNVALAKAWTNVRQALALDPFCAPAHATLGTLYEAVGSPEASTELRRAIALDPAYAPAHQWLGVVLFNQGKPAGANEELRTAERLNPVSPATEAWLGVSDFMLRRYGDSLEHTRRALEIDPQRSDALVQLGMTYDQVGAFAPALAVYDRLARTGTDPASIAALRAHVLARMGRVADARRAIAQARGGPAGGDLREGLVLAFIALGERDRALVLLRGLRTRDRMDAARLALDPRLDPVRDDARFRAWTRLDPS